MDLKKPTYLLVTGASRGIGQTMAIQISQKIRTLNSVVVLMGRNQADLETTKAIILKDASEAPTVYTFSLELASAKANDFNQIIIDSLKRHQPSDFERCIIIHNAGTVGDLSQYARDACNTAVWSEYFHINLFSAIALNCEFMRIFAEVPKIVINLSTKCAVEPFASMTYYCTSKAARDMYFRVLAAEEPAEKTLVLNYAPGVIDTQMSLVVQKQTNNPELAAFFQQQRESKSMLTTVQTASKLIEVLEAQKFKSGDHIDYWD